MKTLSEEVLEQNLRDCRIALESKDTPSGATALVLAYDVAEDFGLRPELLAAIAAHNEKDYEHLVKWLDYLEALPLADCFEDMPKRPEMKYVHWAE
jgi:hypothetical protein